MLLIPLVTGAWVGRPSGETLLPVFLFAVAALALFCLRTPVEAWLQVSPMRAQNLAEHRAVLYSIYFYSSVSALALVVLFSWAHAYGLLLLGAVAATAFFLQAVLKHLGRETRMNAQLTGAIALTAAAAGAYYMASGRLDRTALVVWLANWLLAANQIHFVQTRIHAAHAATTAEKFLRGQGFLLGEALTCFLLGIAWRSKWVPGWTLLAFTPILVRGLAWFFQRPGRLGIHRLGVSELIHALVFGVWFIVSFQIHGG
jgi:hypothetical protein